MERRREKKGRKKGKGKRGKKGVKKSHSGVQTCDFPLNSPQPIPASR